MVCTMTVVYKREMNLRKLLTNADKLSGHHLIMPRTEKNAINPVDQLPPVRVDFLLTV